MRTVQRGLDFIARRFLRCPKVIAVFLLIVLALPTLVSDSWGQCTGTNDYCPTTGWQCNVHQQCSWKYYCVDLPGNCGPIYRHFTYYKGRKVYQCTANNGNVVYCAQCYGCERHSTDCCISTSSEPNCPSEAQCW